MLTPELLAQWEGIAMSDKNWSKMSTDEKLEALREDVRVLFESANNASRRMYTISNTSTTNFQSQAHMVDGNVARLKKVEARDH